MSALTWDNDGERLYETGVDHVVLYPMLASGAYGEGKAWNGVTGITESPEGADANDIYADNLKYLSLTSKENWKATLKAYTFPKEFNACMGHAMGNTGTSFGFFGQQKRQKFALSWRSLWGNDTLGDAYGYKLHLAWGLSAAPSEMDHATENESPEATEFSWELSSIPATTSRKIYVGGGKLAANERSLKPVSHVTVLSTLDSTKLTAIENKLYGTENTTAAIYSLDEFVKFLRGDVS